MNDFIPETPFLRSLGLVLPTLDWVSGDVQFHAGEYEVYFSWFPRLAKGLLTYTAGTPKWGQMLPSVEEENLMVIIAEDGHLQLRQGDDDDVWIETVFNSGDEIPEFIDFYTDTDIKKIGSSASQSKPLSQLVEDVFLLLPIPGHKLCLLPLQDPQFAEKNPKISRLIDIFGWTSNGGPKDSDIVLDKGYGNEYTNELREEYQDKSDELRIGDLILGYGRKILSAGIFISGGHSSWVTDIALVLRPKKEISRMWLTDYLAYAAEADGLVERLCKNLKRMPQAMNNVMVSVPSSKRDQIANTIERRVARLEYLRCLEKAMQLREPFDQVAKNYRKRTRAAECLHTELLDDLVAMQNPLPFFLEYPYRVYRKEDDHIRKVSAGQRLLGMLAKVPLFLVLEELLAAGHSLGHDVLQRLQSAPASDGTLASLHREISDRLAGDPNQPLVLFREFPAFLKANERLMALVTARNRMHHEPFDQVGFLQAMDDWAPVIMESLRGLLKDCRFLIPAHTQVKDGEKRLTAEEISGADAQFRIVVITVSLPLESFPTGQLIAFRDSPEHVLPLGSLLKATTLNQQSRDFAIFDRMVNQKPHFAYVRSE
jgi:hypothetical protein